MVHFSIASVFILLHVVVDGQNVSGRTLRGAPTYDLSDLSDAGSYPDVRMSNDIKTTLQETSTTAIWLDWLLSDEGIPLQDLLDSQNVETLTQGKQISTLMECDYELSSIPMVQTNQPISTQLHPSTGFPVVAVVQENAVRLIICQNMDCQDSTVQEIGNTTTTTTTATGSTATEKRVLMNDSTSKLVVLAVHSSTGQPVVLYKDDENRIQLFACQDSLCEEGDSVLIRQTRPSLLFASRTMSKSTLGHLSMALNPTTGYPHIVYVEHTVTAMTQVISTLYMASCHDDACNTFSEYTIDQRNGAISNTSIQVTSNGSVRVAFQDATSQQLVLAICNGDFCSSKVLVGNISASANDSMELQLYNDIPVLVYHDDSNISIGACVDTVCREDLILLRFAEGRSGQDVSLALSNLDGMPVLAFAKADEVQIASIPCTDGSCRQTNDSNFVEAVVGITTIDPSSENAKLAFPQVQIGPFTGRPVVLMVDLNSENVVVAQCTPRV